MDVKIGVSAHHMHVTREDLDILYGKGYELNFDRPLNQIGQFASKEYITAKTEKGEIKLRILGPCRSYTQVELTKTDSFKMGLNPPVRTSGDLADAEFITLIGPNGTIENKKCVIIADRHIHMTVEEAKKFGFYDGEKVSVRVNTIKGGILDNVTIRAKDNSYFEMHIDVDDGNAFFLKNDDVVEIIK